MKVRYLSYFLLLSILIIPATLFAQGEGAIHGAVVAIADDSMIPGANVSLRSISLDESTEVRTGADGHFGFQRLVPGGYTLTVTHGSFLTETYQLTLRPREVLNITMELTLRPVETAIEVTEEANPIPTIHSPSSTLIGAGRMDDLPMPQRSNLTDVIVASAPGMIRGHDDFVHVRGSEIALNPFINGISFWENAHALFSPGLGADYIESINVMTGGFSAEYGNRFGGILDIVTKSGFSMDNEGSLSLGVGTALRHNGSIEFGGHTENASYYLNVGGFESARFLSPPDPRSIHNTGRGARSFAQFDFALDPSNFLKLVLMGDGANFELPKTSLDDELRPAMNASQRTRSQSLILSWDHIYNPDMFQTTSFYQKWSRSHLLPASDPLGAIADSERSLQTFGIKSELTRFFGSHTVKGGIDLVMLRPDEDLFYQYEGFREFSHDQGLPHLHIHDRAPITLDDQRTGGQISVYLQDKIQLTSALTMDVGLRYDQYSLATSDFQFSPRLNVAYRFGSGTVLHGSYNSFFVPPPIENVLVNSAGLTSQIEEFGEPLPPLRAMVENQFELGVTQPVGRLMRLGLTGYYRISNDPSHTVLFPDSRIYAYSNFDKGKAYGMEIKVEVPTIVPLGLSGYFNYALGRVYFWNPVTAGFSTEADHLHETSRFLAPMDQTHTLTSGFTYRHRPTRLWSSLSFEYGNGTPGSHGEDAHAEGSPGEPEEEHHAISIGPVQSGGHEDEEPGHAETTERVPQHFTQNLTIGWDALMDGDQPRLTLQFNIENLSDNLYLVAQESAFTPGQYSIPRMYSGSIKVRF